MVGVEPRDTTKSKIWRRKDLLLAVTKLSIGDISKVVSPKTFDLLASDLFFINENMKSMTTEQYLYVYPKIFRSEDFRRSLQKLNGEIIVKNIINYLTNLRNLKKMETQMAFIIKY